MRTTLIRLLLAAALGGGAWFSSTEAGIAERRADAQQQIVTLRYADVDRGMDAMTDATVAYWLGQYSEVKPDADDTAADAALLLTAANAAFRQSRRDPAAGPAAVQRLDGVLQAYASALRAAAPQSRSDLGAGSSAVASAKVESLAEAAYNYEYVARIRDEIARTQGKGAKPAPVTAVAGTAGDLPAGPTIHGRPGMPPPEAKMEDLQMLAPMEFGDREAQPEATPGGKRERKG